MALDFTAGCVGGMAGVLVGHPLDTIKVHLQSSTQYRSTFHCFRSILATSGVLGLFRGITSPVLGVSLVNALVFGVYGITERALKDYKNLLTHFTAGATAGLVQSPVCCVIELIKIHLQIIPQSQRNKMNSMSVLKNIYQVYGLRRGLFNALPVTMAREVPAFGMYFFTYELLTNRISNDAPISALQMLIAGGLSGQVSWLITYPLDVVKTRLQSDLGRKYYGNATDCVRICYRQEGFAGFYRGLTPTLLRAFPTNAVCFLVVHWVFEAYNKLNKQVQYADKVSASIGHEHKIDSLWMARVDNLRDNVL